METRLVSFMSVGAVRQMSRTGTEVFSLAHIGELWIFNILPYKTETRRCKICVSVWARRWECDWEDNEIKMENKRHRIHSHTVLPIQSLSAGYASLWHTGSGLWSASTNLLYVHTVILLCSAISAVSLHTGCIVNRLMKGILCWFIMANQIKSSCQVTYVTVVRGKGLLCAHLEFVDVCVFNTQKNNLSSVLSEFQCLLLSK